MSKNLIPEIAKMLGVELGEEFKIKGYDRTYWFDLDGLHSGEYAADDEDLHDLLCGVTEIVKMPWKPKESEKYWTFVARLNKGGWFVSSTTWHGNTFDIALFKAGWVYRTKAEAQAALPAVAKELGVEYKL